MSRSHFTEELLKHRLYSKNTQKHQTFFTGKTTYTPCAQKGATLFSTITLAFIGRFLYFFS